ncbi:class F sortase [Micromonospora sp. CPCC 206060]
MTRGVGGPRGVPRRAVGLALVTLFALVGIFGAGLVVAAFTRPAPRPPQPVSEAAPTRFAPAPDAGGAGATSTPAVPAAPAAPVGLDRSDPTRVRIPRIGVNADIMSLGVNPDGSVEVPPLKQADRAGWYQFGPSPGEIGSAVIVGHVDSKELGPAVFFKLGALRPGDTIQVSRKDGKVVTFTVDGVKAFPKASFPTDLVYAAAPNTALRLVTCGGTFDKKKRTYLDNVVVFASVR